MSNGLGRRMDKIEKKLAERTTKPVFCNCRPTTCFHNAACLKAILAGVSRVCPIHGFRSMGFLLFRPSWRPLLNKDDQFCPCRPHPWRSFVLGNEHTWEAHAAAKEAWHELPPDPTYNFQEDHDQFLAIVAEYQAARQRWIEEAGQQQSDQGNKRTHW